MNDGCTALILDGRAVVDAGIGNPARETPEQYMKPNQWLTRVAKARSAGAETPDEAFDRVEAELLLEDIREHMRLEQWHDRQAEALRERLAELNGKHDWTYSPDEVEQDEQ